jgi:hypothetical protein
MKRVYSLFCASTVMGLNCTVIGKYCTVIGKNCALVKYYFDVNLQHSYDAMA